MKNQPSTVFSFVFLGAPGSGKGTQSLKLQEIKKYIHLSTGDLLRKEIEEKSDIGNLAKSVLEKGSLVSDELIFKIISNKVKTGNDYVFDGVVRTKSQAVTLDSLLKANSIDYKAILFKTEESSVQGRVLSRRSCSSCGWTTSAVDVKSCEKCGSGLVTRTDDNLETFNKRLKIFKDNIEEILNFYKENNNLVVINGDMKPEEITNIILNINNS